MNAHHKEQIEKHAELEEIVKELRAASALVVPAPSSSRVSLPWTLDEKVNTDATKIGSQGSQWNPRDAGVSREIARSPSWRQWGGHRSGHQSSDSLPWRFSTAVCGAGAAPSASCVPMASCGPALAAFAFWESVKLHPSLEASPGKLGSGFGFAPGEQVALPSSFGSLPGEQVVLQSSFAAPFDEQEEANSSLGVAPGLDWDGPDDSHMGWTWFKSELKSKY